MDTHGTEIRVYVHREVVAMLYQELAQNIIHIGVHFNVIQPVNRYGKGVMFATLYVIIAVAVGSQIDVCLYRSCLRITLMRTINHNSGCTRGLKPSLAAFVLVIDTHSIILLVGVDRKRSVHTITATVFKDIERLGNCLFRIIFRFKQMVRIRCQPIFILVGGSTGLVYIRSLQKQVTAGRSIFHVPA